MKVLLVEDHAPSRKMLEVLLRSLGHEPVSTEDGVQAWGEAQRNPYSIVISDWMMPDMDGLELTRRLRSRKTDGYTYVILVTAKVNKEDYHEAMAAGVDDVITKPFDNLYLESRIHVAERIVGLQRHVTQLEDLLHVCSYCRKIRDEQDRWIPVETYLHRRAGTGVSHGVCEDCYHQHVEPELEKLERM